MHTTAPSTTRLLPLQTRVIHCEEGMRLRVVSGRLWLTQPHAAQDLFLGPGDIVDLLQDWVVIGADAQPAPAAGAEPVYSVYQLTPQGAQAPRTTWASTAWQWLQERVRNLQGAAGATRQRLWAK